MHDCPAVMDGAGARVSHRRERSAAAAA
jgi:hypothetical protein